MKRSKKIISLFLAVLMLSGLLLSSIHASEAETVNGRSGYDASLVKKVDLSNVKDIKEYDAASAESAWKITDVEGFRHFSTLVKDRYSFAKEKVQINGQRYRVTESVVIYLANDLDFGGEELAPVGGWTTTNTWAAPAFAGIFDGQGHTLDNFRMVATADNLPSGYADRGYVGLFRNLSGGGIKNLILGEKAVISGGVYGNIGPIGAFAGAIDSDISGDATDITKVPDIVLSNLCNYATVVGSNGIAGGIAAYAKACNLLVDHCTNAGNVELVTNAAGTYFNGYGVGGILGKIGEDSKAYFTAVTIRNCRNTGKLYAFRADVGGIVGAAYSSDGSKISVTVENCVNSGDIDQQSTNVSYKASGILGQQRCTTVIPFVLKNNRNFGKIQAVDASQIAKDGSANEEEAANGLIGYHASLVKKVDLSNVKDIKEYDAASAESSWKITDVEGFCYFSSLVTDGYSFAKEKEQINGQKYRVTESVVIYLANDLDFGGEELAPVGGWTMNTWATPAFAGIFDGQGHTLDNFRMVATADNLPSGSAERGYVGLFRNLSGGGIKNLILGENAVISGGVYGNIGPIGAFAGAIDSNISGYATDSSKVPDIVLSNLWNRATVIGSNGIAGGIAAYTKACNLLVDHCTNTGDVKLVNDTVKGTWFNGYGVGGILGKIGEDSNAYFVTVTVRNCRNTGKLFATRADVGGIVGATYSTDESKISVTVEGCINNGDIEQRSDTGYKASGILGQQRCKTSSQVPFVLKNNRNFGKIQAVDASQIAANGICTFSDTCKVTLESNTVGEMDFTRDMAVSYYQVSDSLYSVDGVGAAYSLRIIATHARIELYSEFGYDITITCDGKTYVLKNPISSRTVYKSLLATENGAIRQYTAAELGGETVSALTIRNIPVALGDITVSVTPFMIYQNQRLSGPTSVFTVSATSLYQ